MPTKSITTCTYPECGRQHYARGLCDGHYAQRRRGRPLVPLRDPDPVTRFWSRVDHSGGQEACWPWLASRNTDGYGHVQWRGRLDRAHRVAWTLAFGDMPHYPMDPLGDVGVAYRCDGAPVLYQGEAGAVEREAAAAAYPVGA